MLQLRLAGVLALALVGVTCRDLDPLAPGLPTRASLAIAPRFERPDLQRAAGGTGGAIASLKTVRGTLTPVGGGAAYEVSADFSGDTAELVFDVAFAGRSQRYAMVLIASDTAGDTLFRSTGEIVAEPGTNAPAAPTLEYVAPDTAVRFLTISVSDTLLVIGDSLALSVSGRDARQQTIAPVRAAWMLRDTSGASISARSGSTARLFGGHSDDDVWIVAETFTGTTDSILVHVRLAVAAVVLNADTLHLTEGDYSMLGAQVVDARGAPLSREVSWMSEDPAIASVTVGLPQLRQSVVRASQPASSYAQVLAHSAGTTRIVAKSSGKTDTVVVVVVPVPVSSVVVTPDSVALLPGQQARLTATPFDALGNPLAGRAASWSADNPLVAKVDGDGVVTAVAGGTATVSAGIEGIIGSAVVRVDTMPATIVRTTVAPGIVELRAIGAQAQLTARSYAADSSLAAANYSWSVGAAGVVSVDSLGGLTALAPGSAYVRAVEPGGTGDSSLVTVSQVPTSVLVTPPAVTLDAVGVSVTFHAIVKDSLGSPIPAPTLYWSVDDPAVGQIDLSSGDSAVARSLAAGYTKVIAWAGGSSGAAELTVAQQIAKTATLGPKTVTLGSDGRARLSLSVFDERGVLMSYAPSDVKWIAEGPAGIVTIDSIGEVLGQGFGNVLVHAEVMGLVSDAVTITVSDNAPSAISFSSDTLTVLDSAVVTVYLSRPHANVLLVALADSNGFLKLDADTLVFEGTTRQQVVLRQNVSGVTTLTASEASGRYATARMQVNVGLIPEKMPADESPPPPPPQPRAAAPESPH